MKKIGLHWWIIIGMLVGAALGGAIHAVHAPSPEKLEGLDLKQVSEAVEAAVGPSQAYQAVDGIATIFLNLLKMIVLPLVFFSLVSGLFGIGDLTRLGRIGIRTFALYIVTSMLAIITGLVLVNAIQPGVGVELALPAGGEVKEPPGSVWEVISGMIPRNVVEAAANFDLMGVIVFSMFFGAFVLTLTGTRRQTIIDFVEGGSEVMLNMTKFILKLAPIGICALVAGMVAMAGINVFRELGWYIVTVFGALGVHLFITLPLLIIFLTKRNPYRYFRAMMPALLTGFSTASSSGTLGITMECAEKRAGISNRVASFVLPLGATINMDGTALYEIVSVLFIAQVHAGAHADFTLSLAQQGLIVFLGLTVSIGAAGIPHAGLVMMVIILKAVGLPVEYSALIWAVDRPLDMCRTMVNIASDSSITLCMAHRENEVDDSVLGGERI